MTGGPGDGVRGSGVVRDANERAAELLLQLTDLHVRLDDGAEEAERRIRVAVEVVLRHVPRPTAVLLSGDQVHGATHEEYARLLELLAPLVDEGHDLLPLMGNHDDRALLREAFASLVPEIAALGDARHVQYVAARGSFRIVALDTLRLGSDAGKLCESRLAWLSEALAADRTTPTILAMHHPPGTVALPAFDDIGLPADQQQQLAELVAAAPNIERIVHGHVHRTITSACAGVPTFGCPSVGLPARPDFVPGVPIALVGGPVGLAVHARVTSGELVTHARVYPEA